MNEVLEDYSKEELIKKFFSVEFTRFFNYYNNASDLNAKASNDFSDDSGDSTRFFINVGAKDDFDWMSLKDFLKATLELGRDDVNRVEVKNNFSFFNVDNSVADKVIATFDNFEYQGRQVNVEVTKSSPRGGGGSRRKSDRGGRKKQTFDNPKSFDKPSPGKGRRRSSDASAGKKSKKGGGRSSNIESSIKRRRSKK